MRIRCCRQTFRKVKKQTNKNKIPIRFFFDKLVTIYASFSKAVIPSKATFFFLKTCYPCFSMILAAPCDFLPLPYPFTYALTLEWDIVAAAAAAGAAGSHLLTTFPRIFPLLNSIIIIIASESIVECSSSIKTQSEGR